MFQIHKPNESNTAMNMFVAIFLEGNRLMADVKLRGRHMPRLCYLNLYS